jgi:2-C-methyl-D-erythritol 4-phosphate cytidylyltransferase
VVEGAALSHVRPVVAVVLAGGVGVRFGAAGPKQLERLGDRTVLEWSVHTFSAAPDVHEVVVVVSAPMMERVRAELAAARLGTVRLVTGGTLRSDSTRAALQALGDRDCDVLLHDAARPLVDGRIIADCVTALTRFEAVTTAVATTDTVAELDDTGLITAIPDRSRLRNVQTPQGFRLSTLRRAFALLDADPDRVVDPSDDCSVVLRYLPDVAVGVVEGSARNLKVTHPHDLDVAAALLADPP